MSKQSAKAQATAEARGALYRRVLITLLNAKAPFLVGGSAALFAYTGVARDSKDLDLFIRPKDLPSILTLLDEAGLRTERTDPIWLAKVRDGHGFVDLIYRSANGLATVDDEWFSHSRPARIHGLTTRIVPPEELIWSKAFIMNRERFDLADILHVLAALGDRLDWDRMLLRFGETWPVLYAYLILFHFCYPSERQAIPQEVLDSLERRWRESREEPLDPERVCRGTILSPLQFQFDVLLQGFKDARLTDVPIPAGEEESWQREWRRQVREHLDDRILILPPGVKL